MARLIFLLAVLMANPAAAQSLRAQYEVHALGATLLELEARYESGAAGYRLETTMRTRGMAAMMLPAQSVSRVQGGWAGEAPAPQDFASIGTWRGEARRVAIDWPGGVARATELLPDADRERREDVPEALRRGALDILSAVVGGSRHIARSANCNLTAAVFDGRRRSDFAATGEARERLSPWRGAWHGEALRCAYESRLVAGFMRDQDRAEASEPRRGTAWMAAPYPGAPVLPVRIEIPTRWFGTVTAVLVRAEPVERRADASR
jgi:hypothetical protein